MNAKYHVPFTANQGTPKTRRGYRHRNYWECRWSERTRKSKNNQDIKDIEAKLYFHTGKGKNKRTIDVQQIFHHFGKEVCSALVGFHCFSGCDSVSALHGMGKVKAVKILMASKEHCSTFEKLGAAFEIPETLYAGLEVFTCVLYGQTNCKDVNHARYQMFKSGRCVEKCLPPNKDSLHKHIQ